MTRFTDIDLARLPSLPLGLDTYEAIRAARLAELTDRLAASGIAYDTAAIETDPLVMIEGAGAYRELLTLTRRDDAVRAVLLSTSSGPFLDHLGASQVPPLARNPLVPEPRPYVEFPADWESDDAFRRRIQLAPEALSTCGPEGAYLFFALETDGVKSAAVWGPMSFGGDRDTPFTALGAVHVPLVAAAGDGTAPPDLVAAVQAELRASDRRPIADFVTVSAAEIVPYQIEAVLKVGPGPDPAILRDQAIQRLTAQALRQHRPGAPALRQQFYGAAYVPAADGAIVVEEVDLIQPAADVNATAITPQTPAGAYRAPFCTGITVTVELAGA